jgi:DNA-binding transcriptional regulator YiaG
VGNGWKIAKKEPRMSRSLKEEKSEAEEEATREEKTIEPQMVFAQAIKVAREKLLLTQEQVAERLQVDARSIRRWESGTALPNLYSRRKLLELLQIDPEEVGLTGEKTGMSGKIQAVVQDQRSSTEDYSAVWKMRWFLVSVLCFIFIALTILGVFMFFITRNTIILTLSFPVLPILYRVVQFYFPLKKNDTLFDLTRRTGLR